MTINIRLKTVRNFVIGLILLVVGLGVGYQYGNSQVNAGSDNKLPQVLVNTTTPDDYQQVDFSLFWEVWRKLEREYLDPNKIDSQDMVYGAIAGMVSSLGDPYTVFLPPRDQQRTEEELSGSFEGIGIQLGYIKNQLGVIAPLRGMPAEAAGIQAGDYILNIKDETKDIDLDTQGMSLPDAVSYIRGQNGVPVTLTMYRDGLPAPFEVSIKRDTIVIPSVELEYIEDERGKVAHLILSRFGGRTQQEWNESVTDILSSNVKGVVLDVRNNPGGYLDGSVFVVSEFVPDGLIVTQQGRLNSKTYNVNRRGRLINTPVVVLVNRGSASASEIVAGALRDRIGAKLVGTRTFGKGTVQTAEELRQGSGIHITISRWLLPGGDWIHDDGITPDIEATNSAETPDVDTQLQTAIETLLVR